MEIRSFLARLLTRHDCLVEETEEARLRVLFPERLQDSLQVGEMEVFDLPRGNGRSLSVIHGGRDFIEVLEPLAFAAGLFSAVAFPRLTFPVSDPEGFLASRLTIQNGIWRLREARPETCGYLVVTFRAVATADTRSERLLAVTVNERTGTIPVGMAALLPALLEEGEGREGNGGAPHRFQGKAAMSEAVGFGTAVAAKTASGRKSGAATTTKGATGASKVPAVEVPDGDSGNDAAGTLAVARRQALIAAGETFREFRDNLNRRLVRDLNRLQRYYLTLAEEIDKRLRKKGRDPEEQARAVSRLEATKNDYLKKIRDARDKYALEIVVEPVGALRVELPVTILDIDLRRRKESRPLSLPVNPLTRGLEAPLCENCQSPVLNFHLCDALHILCPDCFPPCPICK